MKLTSADSILGQHESLLKPYSTISSTPTKDVHLPRAFILLHLPLDESYVRVWLLTHTYMYKDVTPLPRQNYFSDKRSYL